MTAALSIRNLSKIYDNQFEALKGINLEVEEDDFFALLGPNGAGKSTTIGIIAGLVNKTGGDVSVFGCDLLKESQKVKSLIGLVPQEFNFNPFNKVVDIVRYQAGFYGVPAKKARVIAEGLLKSLGIWDKRNDAARNLSGGMKRRLLIARAMVHQPKLLILDEPTAGVDIELRRSMWEYLERINKEGTTIILTTHYLEEAEQLCNKIAIINHGDIVENTDKKSLLSQLKMETMILDLVTPLDIAPELPHFNCRLVDASTLEVDICQNQIANDLFQLLTDKSIQVASLRNKSNRLEELFLNLVSHKKESL
jgi:ABC-2 type transport system ATP-binding protein